MGRAYFDYLNYSLGDEDSSVEYSLLDEKAERVVAVAGSGGRVLPLIARAPGEIVCVDINDAQLAMTALRVAALRVLSRSEFLGMMGYTPLATDERQRMLRDLPLSNEHRLHLEPLFEAVRAGELPIYLGRFERTLQTLASINRRVTGRRGQALFTHEDIVAQRSYMGKDFPHWRWRMVLALLGNSAVLNSLLYKGEFPRKNLPGSAYEIYRNMFEHLFNHTVARTSFFLQMVFLGRLQYESGFPIECDPEVYDLAARAVRNGTSVKFYRGDITECVRANGNVGFVSLSDVPSFLPESAAASVFERVRPGLAPGGKIVMRGHLRVVRPKSEGFQSIRQDVTHLFDAEKTQLWHIDVFQKA
jgi:S-adenosylmethionine-diacylglycerol 3-amino-3-carboxypropyl transferase